jgi:hypothetical protein
MDGVTTEAPALPAPSANGHAPAAPASSALSEATLRAAKLDRAVADLRRAIAGASGRLSMDAPAGIDSLSLSPGRRPAVLAPPQNNDYTWRLLDLDSQALRVMTPQRLMELMVDLSPEISKGLWDYLRFCNPGHQVVAYLPGTKTPFPRAQALIAEFQARLKAEYHSVEVVLNRIFLGTFLRGAVFTELVLDEQATVPVDLATPDPGTVVFERVTVAGRGRKWRLAQWQAGKLVRLDRPTVAYVPVDPLPGSPYGRPLCSPALFSTLFLLGLLHDLRRVVAQQGYPRIDIAISMEALAALMPEEGKGDDVYARAFLDAAIVSVQTELAKLQPDDSYIHSDAITVNKPVGAVDAASLGGMGEIIRYLERCAVRALKSIPLLMSTAEGMSEANANRQWEVLAAGIKAIQHLAEDALSGQFELGLRAQGVVADVAVTFAELRASEKFRDAQTQRLNLQNVALEEARGYIDREEAGIKAVGHPPALPAPIFPEAGVQGAKTGPGGGAGLSGMDAETPEGESG